MALAEFPCDVYVENDKKTRRRVCLVCGAWSGLALIAFVLIFAGCFAARDSDQEHGLIEALVAIGILPGVVGLVWYLCLNTRIAKGSRLCRQLKEFWKRRSAFDDDERKIFEEARDNFYRMYRFLGGLV